MAAPPPPAPHRPGYHAGRVAARPHYPVATYTAGVVA